MRFVPDAAIDVPSFCILIHPSELRYALQLPHQPPPPNPISSWLLISTPACDFPAALHHKTRCFPNPGQREGGKLCIVRIFYGILAAQRKHLWIPGLSWRSRIGSVILFLTFQICTLLNSYKLKIGSSTKFIDLSASICTLLVLLLDVATAEPAERVNKFHGYHTVLQGRVCTHKIVRSKKNSALWCTEVARWEHALPMGGRILKVFLIIMKSKIK